MIKFTTKKREDEVPTNKLMVTDTNNGCKVYELEDILSLMVDDFEFYTINDKHLDIHIFVKAKNYVRYGYGNTIIVQQVNGVDLWYGNINNSNVKLYDYIEKGEILGDTLNNDLYLVYKKEGSTVNYEEYIKS